MMTAERVAYVARTTNPIRQGNWMLTIDDLMWMTKAVDWDSWVYLTPEAAERIAGQLNRMRPWQRGSIRQRAHRLPALSTRQVIDGELVRS